MPSIRALPFARLRDRARLHQVGEGDHLGLDEALLEVGVDHTGRLGSGRALLDRPGAGLLRTRRQIRLEAQGVEADTAQRRQARLFLAHRLEQFQRLVVIELDQLGLDLGVQEDRLGGGDQRALLVLEVLVDQLVLVDVEDVEEGLGGQQVQLVQQAAPLRAAW